jgi:3-hydroxyacyl-CoA dehydrogenase
MTQPIRRVAVLGAGIMGTGIAAHLANAGVESILFDMVPADAKASTDKKARNALAIKAIDAAKKSKPASFFEPGRAALVTPANYDDHGALLGTCDWVVEVVVERLDIKHKVYEWVAANIAPTAVLSSNTSGIPLSDLASKMPADLKKRFLITHFFNPVRYMRLLELVSSPDTEPAIVDRLAAFGEKALGKGIVFAKDTPNFIANRVGLYGIASVFHHIDRLGLGVTAADTILGQPMGRPKSAVFRTADVVGIDTLMHVFDNLYTNAVNDEERHRFIAPDYVKKLVADGNIGSKSGTGFYKKVKGGGGSDILALDLKTGQYAAEEKPRYASVGKVRGEDDPGKRTAGMVYSDDVAGQLAWAVTADTLIYAANRIPEIADDVVNIDRGMKWGFGWDQGPFETWDSIGVAKSVAKMEAEGRAVPTWVKDMLAKGRQSFYERGADGVVTFWEKSGKATPLPRSAGHLILADKKAQGAVVARNTSATLVDLGDGVLGLEFHSKMNALDELIIGQYALALDKLDAGEFDALVVGNQDGRAFCAGANVLMILMGAMQGQWDQIGASVATLQNLVMRAKYSQKPVVTAPFGLTLGGGAEVAMHSAATRAAGELYMGLVEAGVGLIPGAGGCKEMIVRHLGDIPQDVDYDPNPFVQKVFERIGLAKVSTSAEEARQMGFLRPTDALTLDPDALIADAKQTALGLVKMGYVPPQKRTVKLPGRSGAAAIEAFLDQMKHGGYATPHDVTVGKKLAWVLTGGDVPAGTVRTEQDLLDLEREAFLSLAGEAKSQERMQHMLQKGKPLRN